MTLGSRICAQRTAHNLSQVDLADLLEVSRQSVSKWETDASIPELDKLVKMCQVFGVSLDQLVLGGEPAPASLSAQGFRLTPSVSGTALLLMGGLSFVLKAGVSQDLLGALLLALPFLACGGLLLTVKKHLVLWCCWVLWFSVLFYLQIYGYGLFYSLEFFMLGYTDDPELKANGFLAFLDMCMLIVLICQTFEVLRKWDLENTDRHRQKQQKNEPGA